MDGWRSSSRLQQTSIDEVVQRVQQRQGASNVTARNIVNSMRLISDIDWSELFESVSLVDQRLCAEQRILRKWIFRRAISIGARSNNWPAVSPWSEIEVANRAIEASRSARAKASTTLEAERVGDPGYHLIAEGRREFEKAIGFRQPVRVWLGRLSIGLGIRGYVGTIVLFAMALLLIAFWVAWDPRTRSVEARH